MSTVPEQPRASRIVLATVIAAFVAAVILVTAVLPAEYGIDPLGTGRALGLTALSGTTAPAVEAVATATPSAAVAAPQPHLADDEYKVELRPFESVEYKYRLAHDAAFVYSWEASAPVEFEFHGEPDGAPAKYFDSYAKGTAAAGQGTFTAANAGIHGWYWKNHGEGRVTVTLRSAGFYTASTEFRDGDKIQRSFPRTSIPGK
jgi:hypothetical protein